MTDKTIAGCESRAVHYCVDYHKYWLDKEMGWKNPKKNEITKYFLDLKKQSNSNFATAVAKLYAIANERISSGNILPGKWDAVAVVPSSQADSPSTGLVLIASALKKPNIVGPYRADLLVRHTSIPKLATGGGRAIQVHLDSIVVKGKVESGTSILLLDDITTTGNSLHACEYLLLQAGAGSVTKLAIGKTVHD